MSDSVLATSPDDTASISTCKDLLGVIEKSVDLAAHFKRNGGSKVCKAVAMHCGNTIRRRSWLFLWRRLEFEVPTARYVYFFPETFNGRKYGVLKNEFGNIAAGIVVESSPHVLVYMRGYEDDIYVELVPHGVTQPPEFVSYILGQLKGFTRKRSA